MCRRIRTLLFVLLAGALLAPALSAQDWAGRGRIQGLVTDEAGNPIEGATIKLTKVGRDVGPEPLETNAKGRWSYLGLSGGQWKVEIEYPGYAISEGVFPVSEFSGNEPIRVQLQKATAVAAGADGDADAAKAAAEAAKLAEAGRLAEQGKTAEARAIMEEVLPELEPSKQVAVLLAIAKTHYQDKNTEATIATLEKGLAIDPNHVESLKLISSILVNEGRTEEADAYRSRLPQGEKIDPNALLNQGIAKYNANDLDGALAEFDKIVAEYPDLPDAYYYRGLVYLGKAENEKAVADFEKMLELDPNHANAGEAKQFLDYLRSQ